MGVRGLSTFLREFSEAYNNSYKFFNCTIIIDGWNLIHYLYKNVMPKNLIFCGDYVSFAVIVIRFFYILLKNKIIPLLIFDGCSDPDGLKSETIMRRHAELNAKCQNLVPANLPYICEFLFLDIMKSLDIPFYQSIFEADNEIASLSNQLKAPVISNDSDFFIFPLTHGLIPLSSLNIDQYLYIPNTIDTDILSIPKKCQLNCSIYLQTKLFNEYPGLHPKTLAVFALVNGNDISHKYDYSSFVKMLESRKSCTRHSNSGHKISGYLKWFSRFPSSNDCIGAIVDSLKKEDRESAKYQLDTLITSYDVQEIPTERVHNIQSKIKRFTNAMKNQNFLTTKLNGLCDLLRQFPSNEIMVIPQTLPSKEEKNGLQPSSYVMQNELFAQRVLQNIAAILNIKPYCLPSDSMLKDFPNFAKTLNDYQAKIECMDFNYILCHLLIKRKIYLSIQIENFRLPSVHDVSAPLRRLIYAKLYEPLFYALGIDFKNLNRCNNGTLTLPNLINLDITEIKRKDKNLVQSINPIIITEEDLNSYNHINAWTPLTFSQLVLPDTYEKIRFFPESLKVFCLSTIYFIQAKNTNHKTNMDYMDKLILSLVMTITLLTFPLFINNYDIKRSNDECTIEDFRDFAPSFNKYKEKMSKPLKVFSNDSTYNTYANMRNGVNLHIIHLFGEWQSCFLAILLLNQVCDGPLYSTNIILSILTTLNGSLMHNVCQHICNEISSSCSLPNSSSGPQSNTAPKMVDKFFAYINKNKIFGQNIRLPATSISPNITDLFHIYIKNLIL